MNSVGLIASKPPNWALELQSDRLSSKILTTICDNFETARCSIRCQLGSSNRKSHTGFRLVPTSVTLNDLKRRNSSYFAFFSPNSIALESDYLTVVEDRPAESSPTFGQNLPMKQSHGLSAIAELLVNNSFISK